MRKIITLVCALFAVIIMAACGSGNSPKAAAEKTIKCLADNDYKGFADLVYIDEDKYSEEEQVEQRKQIAEVLESKFKTYFKATLGEVKSYKVLSVEMSEDGNKASVKMNIVYEKDGKEKEDTNTMDFRKNKAGKWMVSLE